MDGFNRMTSNPCLGILIKKCPTKVLYWNGRGLANSQTRLVLNSQTRSSDFGWTLDCFREHPSIFLEESPTFSSCCQLQKSSLPNLWCLSRQNLSLVVLASSDQHCSFQICLIKKLFMLLLFTVPPITLKEEKCGKSYMTFSLLIRELGLLLAL